MIYHLRHRQSGGMIEEHKIAPNIHLMATSQAKYVAPGPMYSQTQIEAFKTRSQAYQAVRQVGHALIYK
jgi:hypothetical protein